MKRKQSLTKTPRLYTAKRAKWTSEFPLDVWGLIIPILPRTMGGMLDLTMMFRLLRVCKAMTPIVLKECLPFLASYLRFDFQKSQSLVGLQLWQLSLYPKFRQFIQELSTSDIDLRRYLIFSLYDSRFQTTEHLSNWLSLFDLKILEDRHSDGKGKLYEMTESSMIDSAFYYRHEKKKAVILKRMKNVFVIDYDKMALVSLRSFVKNILEKQGLSVARILDTLSELFRLPEPQKTVKIFEFIEGSEQHLPLSERTFKICKPKRYNRFQDLIIVSSEDDEKRQHIYSDEMQAFREKCFCASGSVENATYHYLLNHFCIRNLDVVQNTMRYYIDPKEKLELTCKHEESLALWPYALVYIQ